LDPINRRYQKYKKFSRSVLLRTTIFAAMIITLRHQLAIQIVARFPPILSRYTQPERDIPLKCSHSTRVRRRSGESLAAKYQIKEER